MKAKKLRHNYILLRLTHPWAYQMVFDVNSLSIPNVGMECNTRHSLTPHIWGLKGCAKLVGWDYDKNVVASSQTN